jgi:hypothetical protein
VAGNSGTTLATASTYPITSSWAATASIAVSASYSQTASVALTLSSFLFSRGGTIYDPLGLAGSAAYSQSLIVWRAPFSCSVIDVWGYRVGGNGAVINARKNGTGSIATSNLSLTSVNTWVEATPLNTESQSFIAGDKLEIMMVSCSAYPTQISVQVDFTR